MYADYRFVAIYATTVQSFTVFAYGEVEARKKARSVASRALCLILRRITLA